MRGRAKHCRGQRTGHQRNTHRYLYRATTLAPRHPVDRTDHELGDSRPEKEHKKERDEADDGRDKPRDDEGNRRAAGKTARGYLVVGRTAAAPALRAKLPDRRRMGAARTDRPSTLNAVQTRLCLRMAVTVFDLIAHAFAGRKPKPPLRISQPILRLTVRRIEAGRALKGRARGFIIAHAHGGAGCTD